MLLKNKDGEKGSYLPLPVAKGGLAAGEEAKCCGICSVLGKGGSQVAEIGPLQETNIFC